MRAPRDGGTRREPLPVERQRVAALYAYEKELAIKGFQLVAGVDEAGRGPLAGPVVAAAVILPPGLFLAGLNDSKKVTATRRLELAEAIRREALAWSVAAVGVAYIGRYNILQASLEAMRRAVARLTLKPQHLLVDGLYQVPGLELPQWTLVGGDGRSASIGAASIVAKVWRDGLMQAYDRRYPGYGFAAHKGYPTSEHYRALELLGPCPIHRRTFRGVG